MELHRTIHFEDAMDINGDGWCDWISMAAREPHRGDVEDPKIKDFIFLGTKNGWRKFGDMKKFLLDRSDLTAPGSGWVRPDSGADGFIFPTFVYSRKESAPYFAALNSFEDTAPSSMEDIYVFKWEDVFDMPRTVSDDDRRAIFLFLRNRLCETPKNPTAEDSLARVILQTSLLTNNLLFSPSSTLTVRLTGLTHQDSVALKKSRLPRAAIENRTSSCRKFYFHVK